MLYLSRYKRKRRSFDFEGMFWIGDGADHLRAIAFQYIPDGVETVREGLHFLQHGDVGFLSTDERLAIAILNLNDPVLRDARNGYRGRNTGWASKDDSPVINPRLRSDR